MKNRNLYKLLGIMAVIAVAIVGIAYIFAPDSFIDFLTGAGGVMLAAAPAAAPAQTMQGIVQTTTDASKTDDFQTQEINRPSVSKSITKVMPSLTPLDTMLRELAAGTTKSDRYEYYSVVSRGTTATIKETVAETAAPEVAAIKLVSAHMLSLDGCLLVPSYEATASTDKATAVESGVAKKPLVLHIVEIDYAANQIKVIALNASHVPALTASDILYRMGSAKDQLAAISSDPQIMPTKDFNYCQINMCTISQSKFQQMQEKEVEFGMADLRESAILDFRYQNEVNSLFGFAREIIDPVSQKRKYTMDGFVRKISKFLDKGEAPSISSDVINGWMADIFDCNNGSDTRVMLYGADFATQMANSAVFSKQLEAGKTEIKFGLTWNRIETNFGSLLCRMHTGLGMNGYGNAAIVIDPANIRRIEQMPLTAETLDLDKAGQRRTDDVRLSESFTLEVTNPDTHAVLFG